MSGSRLRAARFTALILLPVGAAGASPAPLLQDPAPPLVFLQEGDLPLILSAPHGGRREIPGVPPRRGEGMKRGPSGFTAARDGGTEELAHAVAAAILERTGKRPYAVVASFHRRYLDCNRPPAVAFEHEGARAVYEEYHGALQRYRAAVVKTFGGGLLLDLHGQGIARDTIFRGTQNGRTTALMQERFGKGIHAGPDSLLGRLKARGWTVHPEDEGPEKKGFTGGHITQTYGTREGGLDAVQLEFGADFRAPERRKATAEVLAEILAGIAAIYTAGGNPPPRAPPPE